MTVLKLIGLCFGLALIPSTQAQIPDITYTMAWYILPYTPMPDLYNFVQALNNKDTTTKDKKARATKFITNNWGKPKVQNATFYNTKDKAQKGFAGLITHRAAVQTFWNDFMMKKLLALFNNNQDKCKEYKSMYIMTDKTFDQDFWSVLGAWYTYSHYHTVKDKRDALFDAINDSLTAYFKKSTVGPEKDPLNWSIYTQEYLDYLINTFINGMW